MTKAEYNRQWNKNNREARREINRRWTSKNRRRSRDAQMEWRRTNKDHYAKTRRKKREKEWRKMGLTRSQIMSRIRSVSKLEFMAAPICRQLAGVPIRHQPKGILGHPDFASKSKKVAVFVDGCMWHGHPCRPHYIKTNRAFWVDKIAHNQARDSYVTLMLEADGWTVIRVPECEIKALLKRRAVSVGGSGGLSAHRSASKK